MAQPLKPSNLHTAPVDKAFATALSNDILKDANIIHQLNNPPPPGELRLYSMAIGSEASIALQATLYYMGALGQLPCEQLRSQAMPGLQTYLQNQHKNFHQMSSQKLAQHLNKMYASTQSNSNFSEKPRADFQALFPSAQEHQRLMEALPNLKQTQPLNLVTSTLPTPVLPNLPKETIPPTQVLPPPPVVRKPGAVTQALNLAGNVMEAGKNIVDWLKERRKDGK